MTPDPATPKRWRPRFSLRSLLILVCLAGSGFGLWYRWEPWVLVRINSKYWRPVRAVCFSPESKTFVTAGANEAYVWKTSTLDCLASLKGHEFIIHSVAFSSDGKKIIVRRTDREIISKNTIYIEANLYLMDADGSNETKLIF